MRTIFHTLVISFLLLLSACGIQYLDGEDPSSEEVQPFDGEGDITRFDFVPGTTLTDVIDILANASIGRVNVRVGYPDHESDLFFNPSADDMAYRMREEEIRRLETVIEEFDPNDTRERAVWMQLVGDLDRLDSGEGIAVRWVEVPGDVHISSSYISKRSVLKADDGNAVHRALLEEDIIDWDDDEWYSPVAGTSTIWEAGTLQKFWFDSGSLSAVSSSRSGLEIVTLVSDRPGTQCGLFGVRSNLPDYYRDTQMYDDSTGPRNCAVGTISASELVPHKLYWTWHPFSKFTPHHNPRIDIQYQPKRWCSWISSRIECSMWKSMCMCNQDDMPTDWLVRYHYNDAPGKEVKWFRD